jgi:hypothetical protein
MLPYIAYMDPMDLMGFDGFSWDFVGCHGFEGLN